MADVKEYAYYIEGSSLALVERDVEFDNDPNSKDYGPGTDKYVWKSPLSSVTDGLELQYTYSPNYTIQNAINEIKFSFDQGKLKLKPQWYSVKWLKKKKII